LIVHKSYGQKSEAIVCLKNNISINTSIDLISNLKVITGDKELKYLKAIQTQKGGGFKKKDNLLRSFNLKTMR
jgi:hypothetical protein